MHLDQQDKLFLQRCKTSIIVPADDDASLDEILGEDSDITSRTTLHFGMLTNTASEQESYSFTD